MDCGYGLPPDGGRRPVAWRKSTYSNGMGNCVEVAVVPGGVAIRDSQAPDGGARVVARAAFAAFLAGVRSGRPGLH